jgi:hypothetical protein
MKSWQSILISGCITILVITVAIGLFLSDAQPDKTKEILKSLDDQINEINGIQLKLTAIEEAILNQKSQVLMTPATNVSVENPEFAAKLNQKLDLILEKLHVFENHRSFTQQVPQTFGSSFGPTPKLPGQLPLSFSAKGKKPTIWIDRLSGDKKREVEIIFEENAARLRENLPPLNPDGSMPDHQTISEIVQESDLQLKQDLKTVLTEEEYQQFLDSQPEPLPEMFNAPGIEETQ